MREFKRVPFNEDVVDTLKKLLVRADEGKVNFLAFAICEGASHGEDGFVGDVSCYSGAYYGLHHCADRIMSQGNKIAAPNHNFVPPANMWRYDVSIEPMNHDFIAWLVTAKMMQAREGIPGPTKVCFARHTDEHAIGFLDNAYRQSFYHSVCVPALTLFDCVQAPEAINGRVYPMYAYRDIVDAATAGEAVPHIQPPAAALKAVRDNLDGIEPVVITLREHKQWDHRNSDLTAWIKFAEYLEERGEHVIFLRDYANADEEISGFDTMPEASKNLFLRAALYESAKCNMFVSNGPSSFGLFGSRPWLMFVDCRGDEVYKQNTPEWWKENHGIERGSQFPWSAPNQRMVWAPDTYENMVKAWEDLFPMLKAEAA